MAIAPGKPAAVIAVSMTADLASNTKFGSFSRNFRSLRTLCLPAPLNFRSPAGLFENPGIKFHRVARLFKNGGGNSAGTKRSVLRDGGKSAGPTACSRG